jgi:hypothetical protein
MSKQLRLIDTSGPVWRLDDETKRVGREGIAAAREALRRSRPQYPGGPAGDPVPARRAA